MLPIHLNAERSRDSETLIHLRSSSVKFANSALDHVLSVKRG